MKACIQCNTLHSRPSSLCYRCYTYLRKHPEGYYPIPSDGVMEYALNGDPICHECGAAYAKLGQHISNHHDMTPTEYKDKHNLLHNTRLTNASYQEKMRNYNKKHYRKVVKKNLLKGGVLTRFRVGQIVPGRGKHIKKNVD